MAKKKKTGRVHQKPRRRIKRQRRTRQQIEHDKQYESKWYKRADDLKRDIKMINERIKTLVKRLGPKSTIVQQVNTAIDTVIPPELRRWGKGSEIQLSGPKNIYETPDIHEAVKMFTKTVPTYKDIKEQYAPEYEELREWDPASIEGVSMEDFIEINESLPDALSVIYDRIEKGTADTLDELAISVMKDKGERRIMNYATLSEIIGIAKR